MKIDFSDYGYANARVKALKTKLLDSARTRQLQDLGSVDQLVALLEETNYKQEMVKASADFKGIRLVSEALHANLVASLQSVYSWLPPEGREAYEVVLNEFEVSDLKKVLTSKAENRELNASELANVFESKVVAKALAARDLKQSIDVIKNTPGYEKAFSEEWVKQAIRSGDYRPLLIALDNNYFKRLAALSVDTDSAQLTSVIDARLDFKNTMLVLRMLRDGLPLAEIEKRLLPSKRKYWVKKLLACKDYADAVELSAKKYGVGEEELKAAVNEKKLSAFEIAVETGMVSRVLRASRLSVMDFGTILGFVYLKSVEVENIRKIAYGIHFGLKDELKKSIIAFN
ncbi:MAG: V-type ATPase subunit [Candidatus Micrarchaeota archaeon]